MQGTETLIENQTATEMTGAEKLQLIIKGCKFKLINYRSGYHYKSEDHGLGIVVERYNAGGFRLCQMGWLDTFDSTEHCLTVNISGIFKSQLDRIPMSLIQILND